jgi:hypothetical protein
MKCQLHVHKTIFFLIFILQRKQKETYRYEINMMYLHRLRVGFLPLF